MSPAPTRQLYIVCKYMSIKKRGKRQKATKTSGQIPPACGGIGFRGCQD